MLPERFGADILIRPHRSWGGWVGVQRKELSDLLSSLGDGRFSEQVQKLTRCRTGILLIEGRPSWTTDGVLVSSYGRPITRESWRALLWSVRHTGLWVDFTDGLADTLVYLASLDGWLSKERHGSLISRPKPEGRWGVVGSRDWERHMLMGLPGIGAQLAEAILDTVGYPLRLGVSADELLAVPGLGPRRVAAILAAFPPAPA